MFIAIASDDKAKGRNFLRAVLFKFHVIVDGAEVQSRYGLDGYPATS